MLSLIAFAASLSFADAPAPPQCFPARTAIVVDGDLSDWDRRGPIELDATRWFDDGASGAERPRDAADASLTAYFEWDAENLYLAGEVRDDSRVYDDRLWFNGDCIELFVDSDREGDRERPLFDDDDFELCLMPYNVGRSFGLVKHGRDTILAADGLAGVVARAKPTTNAGYTFEVRVPWRNFPRFDLESRDFGLALALIDVDRDEARATTRSFLVHAGPEFTYLTTRGFLPVQFVGEPRRTAAADTADGGRRFWIWVLEVLVAIGLIVAAARFADIVFERAYGVLRRAKRTLAVALVALAALLFVGPMLATRMLESLGRERFDESAAIIGRVIGGLADRESLGRAAIERPEDVLGLMRGRGLPGLQGYDYRFLELAPLESSRNFRRSLEGVPVRSYGIPLEAQRQHYFTLPQPTVLSRLFVFGRTRLDAAERERPGASLLRDQALEIGVRLLDGRLRTESFPALDRGATGGQALPRSERFEKGFDEPGGPVEQYFLGAPTIASTLVQAIVVTLRDPDVQFELFGVTYCAADAPDRFEPMPLTRASLAGPPSAFFDGFPRDSALTIAPPPAAATTAIRVGARLDALWFFYDSLDPAALDPALRGVEVGRFVARDSTGAEHVASLRAGVNLFHGLYDAAKRPSDTDSQVGFRWTDDQGTARRIELLELELPGTPLVEEIRIENKGPLAGVALYAITGGTRSNASSEVGDPGLTFSVDGAELRIAPDLVATLDDAGLAVAIGDTIVASDFADSAPSGPLIGARAPFGEELSAQGEAGQRIALFGEPYRSRSFTLPRPNGAEWQIVLFSPVPGVSYVARAQRHGFILALLLGLPLVILIALDFGARIARLGPRLTTLLVATSLTPIVILFAVLYDFVADDRARLRESRAEAALREVESRFAQVLLETRRIAEQVASSDALRAVRTDAPLDEAALRSYLADVVAVRAASARGIDLAVRLEIDGPGGQRTRVHDRVDAESMSRFDLDGRGVFVHWDQLVLLWTQDVSVGAFRRRVTVAAEVRDAFLSDLATLADARVAVLAPDGRSLAGSLAVDPDLGESEIERIRRTNRALLRQAADGSLRATHLLAVGDGEPAALVQIGLAPDEFSIDVLVARLPLESFFFWFCALGLAAAVFMGSVATSRITGPMERLETAVRRIGEGELDVRVDLPGSARGEVARLAEAFNGMARELRMRSAERKRLERAHTALNASIDVEATATAALAVLAEEPVAESAAIYVRDAERERWLRYGTHAALATDAPGEIAKSRLFDTVARRRAPLFLPRDADSVVLSEPLAVERAILAAPSALVLPLSVSDRCVGVAILTYPSRIELATIHAEIDMLSHLAAQVAVSLENAKLFQLAVVDPETGLYVESSFRSRFAEEVDRAHRRDAALALLLVAVEGVRRLERSQGADVVRESMSRIGRFLKISSRDMVLAGRVGSGFALASPETDGAQAEVFRQRLLRDFAALDGGQFRESTNLQLHIGVATFPQDGASSVFLFDAANRAVAASRRARMTEALATPQGTVGSPEIDPAPFVFQAPVMKELLSQIARVANSNASVLVLGETGSGKEVVAELLHRFSDRSHRTLVAINCSAVPENLLEAELFGYERGAFTGALRAKPGQFELADGGTLFLDEVGDLPLALQSKLLRVLQDRLVVRLGARKGTEVDVRIVAATNRDLSAMMEQGRFRTDLYFRLKVVTLALPPLRERREDLPHLADLFVRQFNAESGQPPKALAPATLDALHGYDWPGNVRELRNVLHRAFLMSESDVILPTALEFERKPGSDPRREARGVAGGAGGGVDPVAPGGVSVGEGVSEGAPDGLNERQRRFLSLLAAEGGTGRIVRSRDYFEIVGVTSRTGLRDLHDLVRRGLLVRDGRRRGAAYRLPGPESSQIPAALDPTPDP